MLSIITPAYKNPNGLSVLIDTIAQIKALGIIVEYIIVDGGLDAETKEIVSQRLDTVDIFISEHDNGIYDALNKGIAISSGTHIYFANIGDNIFINEFYRFINYCQNNADTQTKLIYYSNVKKLKSGKKYDGKFNRLKLAHKNICHQSILYPKVAFDELGYFDTRYPLLSDWEFNLKCFSSTNLELKYINYTICEYEGGGASEKSKDHMFYKNRPQLVLKHLGLFPWLIIIIIQKLKKVTTRENNVIE